MLNIIGLPLLLSFLAGISTVFGSLIFLFIKDFKKSYLSFFLGISAGAMIYISFIELLPEAIKVLGFFPSNIAFFFGIFFIGIIDIFIPHHFMKYCSRNGVKYDKLMVTGVMVAIGIAIHNFPEGIAVFMSSLGNAKFGFLIAFATAVHNIPEGVAVATPVYFATKSKKKAFWYSFLAGIAEPIGAIMAYVILQPYLSPTFLAYIFAFVAGIMVYISIDELLPSCFENCQGHTAIAGIVLGMLVMMLSLTLL
jgi:ZIP family zinc transporter